MSDAADGRDAEGSGAVDVLEGITYAEREAGDLHLDLFVPDREEPPLVVYFHGGGWMIETRDNVPEPERYAAELGYAIASVDYRLSEIPDDVDPTMPVNPDNPVPRGVFPDHFVDAKASIRWLRVHADDYGYDASKIAAWGASAGGHLAALAGVVNDVMDLAGEGYSDAELEKEVAPQTSGVVQAVVDWYGVHDLTEFPEAPGSPHELLIGGPQSEHEAEYRAASPVSHVTGDDPPFLMMHGREDEVVPVEQSRLLADALDEVGVGSVLYELHDLNHVFVENVEDIESERVAMDLLMADPTPAQSMYAAHHAAEGESFRPLVEGTPPAGPEPIRQFLDATIGDR